MQVNSNYPVTQVIPNSSKTSTSASDFDTFLRMLTVQIQNQDPLNPMESTEFAVQLATFAGVEQQIRTNQALATMSSQMAMSAVGQVAGWIGMEARVRGPVDFDGAPLTLLPSPHGFADRAVLVVTNPAGQVVAREPITPNQTSYAWRGEAADGSPLPPGRYNLQVESYLDDNLLETSLPEYYALVTEARMGASGAELVLESGLGISAAQISALRRP